MVSGVTDHRSAERRADAREEAGVDGSDVVTPLLGELPEQVLLLRGEVRGDVDEDADDEVASVSAFEVGHAAAFELELLARGGAAGDHEVFLAVEGVELEVGSEGGLGKGQRQVAVQVDAIPREPLVRLDPNVHVEVAVGPSPWARRPPVGETEGGSGVDPTGMSTV